MRSAFGNVAGDVAVSGSLLAAALICGPAGAITVGIAAPSIKGIKELCKNHDGVMLYHSVWVRPCHIAVELAQSYSGGLPAELPTRSITPSAAPSGRIGREISVSGVSMVFPAVQSMTTRINYSTVCELRVGVCLIT